MVYTTRLGRWLQKKIFFMWKKLFEKKLFKKKLFEKKEGFEKKEHSEKPK